MVGIPSPNQENISIVNREKSRTYAINETSIS